MQKLFSIIVLSFLFIQSGLTQKQYKDYKELYKAVGAMKDFEAYQALLNYTAKVELNTNAFYHIGLIMQRFIGQYDPFLEREEMRNNIKLAELYLQLSKQSLNEKEAKRLAEYYPDVKPDAPGKKPGYDAIIKDIDKRIEDVDTYKKYYNENISYLVNCINNYNFCIVTFGEINQQNSRLNDLYFLVDNEMETKLDALSLSFDSTLYYLDKLKASLEEYPMGGYTINYSLKPIPVYRLYGLTSSDFLKKDIALWDFRSWVKTFREVENSDVDFLYKSIEELNTVNHNYISKLAKGNSKDIPANYKINPLIINKMLKYDFNSATAALLSYQEEKINYLYHNADNKVDNGGLSSLNRFRKSADYYLNLIKQKQAADSLLSVATSKVTPEAIKKYDKFFNEAYNGIDGYKEYLEKEEGNNNTVLTTSLNTYKNMVLASFLIDKQNEKAIMYNNEPIYIKITTPDLMEGTGYFIHSRSAVYNKQSFITGTYDDGKDKSAFAALVDSMGMVKWLKPFKQGTGNKHGMLAATLNDGYAIVVSTVNDGAIKNHIYRLDMNGNTKLSKEIPSALLPRKVIYDDIASTYLLAFKGNAFNPYEISDGNLQLYMLTADLSVLWESAFAFNGYLANVIKTNDNFYVYGAYNKLTDTKGQTHVLSDEKYGVFAHTFGSNGEGLLLSEFDTDFSYYPLQVSKINNEYVEMLGVANVQPDKLITQKHSINDNNKVVYMIITADNKIYYNYE